VATILNLDKPLTKVGKTQDHDGIMTPFFVQYRDPQPVRSSVPKRLRQRILEPLGKPPPVLDLHG